MIRGIQYIQAVCEYGTEELFGLGAFGAPFRKAAFASTLLCLMLFQTGCRTTGEHVNWYPGPPRGTNEIGLVKFQHDFLYGRAVFLQRIDNARFGMGHPYNNTRQIELLPGLHDLELSYFDGNSGAQSVDNFSINFNCQGGHVYDLFAAPIQNSKEFPAKFGLLHETFYLATWIIDEQTEAVVAGNRFTKYFIVNNGVTSLGTGQRGHRMLTATFTPQEVIRCFVEMQVDDPIKDLGPHDVVFNWYSGSTLLEVTTNETFSFDGMTTKFSSQKKPASTLGLGHFRVDVIIKGETVTSQEFSISQ